MSFQFTQEDKKALGDWIGTLPADKKQALAKGTDELKNALNKDSLSVAEVTPKAKSLLNEVNANNPPDAAKKAINKMAVAVAGEGFKSEIGGHADGKQFVGSLQGLENVANGKPFGDSLVAQTPSRSQSAPAQNGGLLASANQSRNAPFIPPVTIIEPEEPKKSAEPKDAGHIKDGSHVPAPAINLKGGSHSAGHSGP